MSEDAKRRHEQVAVHSAHLWEVLDASKNRGFRRARPGYAGQRMLLGGMVFGRTILPEERVPQSAESGRAGTLFG